jgi:hypothetical protein
MGRFINRDPIGEAGGINQYGFCANNAVNGWDYLGMDMNVGWVDGRLEEVGPSGDEMNSAAIAQANQQAIMMRPGQAMADAFRVAAAWESAHGNNSWYEMYDIWAGKMVSKESKASNKTESQIYIIVPDANGKLVPTVATAQDVVALAKSQGGTVDVFVNGQSNDLNKAIRLGSNQLGASSFVLFYNPTHGDLADTFESLVGKLTGTSQVGREFGNFLSATSGVNVNLVVHSQGGITANIGMNQVLSQGGSLPNLTIYYNGAAVNATTSQALVSNVGATFNGFSINRGDPVPLLAGGNAQNIGQVLLAIVMLPSTITGLGSPHTNYAPIY